MSTTTKEITTLKQNCGVKEWKAQIDENEQKIVPLKLNLPKKIQIVIEKNDLKISFSSDVDKDILISVVNALC